MLHESALGVLRDNPLVALSIPLWLSKGKAALKRHLANHVEIDPVSLPYNLEFLNWLKQEKKLGRKLILCTASDHSIALTIAEHLNIFDEIIASNGMVNLEGKRKAEELVKRFGHAGYDYAGNSNADLIVWKSANRAIVVNASSELEKLAGKNVEVERIFPAISSNFMVWRKVLRVRLLQPRPAPVLLQGFRLGDVKDPVDLKQGDHAFVDEIPIARYLPCQIRKTVHRNLNGTPGGAAEEANEVFNRALGGIGRSLQVVVFDLWMFYVVEVCQRMAQRQEALVVLLRHQFQRFV